MGTRNRQSFLIIFGLSPHYFGRLAGEMQADEMKRLTGTPDGAPLNPNFVRRGQRSLIYKSPPPVFVPKTRFRLSYKRSQKN